MLAREIFSRDSENCLQKLLKSQSFQLKLNTEYCLELQLYNLIIGILIIHIASMPEFSNVAIKQRWKSNYQPRIQRTEI